MDVQNAVQLAAPFTAGWEQFRPYPYWDVNGYAIGYGNHYYQDGSSVGPDDTIDQPTAYQLMTDTLAGIASDISSAIQVPVSDNMLAALSDLGYNWGAGNVKKSKLLGLINSGAAQGDVATQWNITAVTSGGSYDADLQKRRTAELNFAYAAQPDILGMLVVGVIAFYFLFFLAGTVHKGKA